MQPPAARLICYLLRMVQPGNFRGVNIVLSVNKKLIAAQLNLIPETLSRYFALLKKEKLISLNGKQLTIHSVADLESYAEYAISHSVQADSHRIHSSKIW